MRIGSEENGEFTFIDIVSLASFIVALQNLDENIDQTELSKQLDRVLAEVHSHLEQQDRKIEQILEELRR